MYIYIYISFHICNYRFYSFYKYYLNYIRLKPVTQYIYYWSTFFIDKLIICQDVGKKWFLFYYLENVLTKFLLLSLLLIGLNI